MFLYIENASKDKLDALLEYAQQLNLHIRVIGQDDEYVGLPGKTLSSDELTDLIELSRNSGVISMKTAHSLIRKGNDEQGSTVSAHVVHSRTEKAQQHRAKYFSFLYVLGLPPCLIIGFGFPLY